MRLRALETTTTTTALVLGQFSRCLRARNRRWQAWDAFRFPLKARPAPSRSCRATPRCARSRRLAARVASRTRARPETASARSPIRPCPCSVVALYLKIKILEDQAEQEMHVAAVGSTFRRLGSIGSPHLAQVPYVPSDIRPSPPSI